MNNFTLGLSDLVKMEYKATKLIKEMDVSRFMTYAEQVESEKLQKMRMKESKRVHFNGGFSNAKSGGGRFQQGQGSSKGAPQRFDEDRVSNPKAQGDVVKGGVIS